jgi:aspartyl-tRNA(Asn)/glutamyl-tRNA(Gln) amidotransferase subunit C
MKITREDVLRVAELANIDFSETEVETFGQQLGSILTYCEQLNELDTSNVEPMAQVLTGAAEDTPQLREDAARDAGIVQDVLRIAPDPSAPYFRVPRVIDR